MYAMLLFMDVLACAGLVLHSEFHPASCFLEHQPGQDGRLGRREQGVSGWWRDVPGRPHPHGRGRSVNRAGRGGVGELPDGVRDPAQYGYAVVIAGRYELVNARSAFLERLLAIALEHQSGGTPDVDLGNHAEGSHERARDDKSARPRWNSGLSRAVCCARARPCGTWSPTTLLSQKQSVMSPTWRFLFPDGVAKDFGLVRITSGGACRKNAGVGRPR
jgi:hypothetical protein